ncbi:hypothetical protein [Sphingomonas sp.]|uniref:energy transducer TonB n=1 Tax=Sphingomonas sp. TaxID=28214 RepID=UPI0025EEDB7F|nr:hypothetical protein [Sphingomonas sp.]
MDRSGYLAITHRRRAVTVALVGFLYIIVALILLGQRAIVPDRLDPVEPIVVTLLPVLPPPEPPVTERVKQRQVQRSANGAQSVRPTRVTVDAPPRLTVSSPASAPAPATVAPTPLPPVPDVTAVLSAPAVAVANPGGGDRVDNGASGTGEGSRGVGGNNGGGGGGGAPNLESPHWLHKVSDDELLTLFNGRLPASNIEVDFRMRCTIALSTRMTCRVLKETPFYPGLRRAVLAAVPLLRMAPGKRDGRPIDGQRVEFLWRITVGRGDVTPR